MAKYTYQCYNNQAAGSEGEGTVAKWQDAFFKQLGERKPMTADEKKGLIIELIILFVSLVVAIQLVQYFRADGLYLQAMAASCLPGTALGLYILFGKYLYFKDWVFTKKIRLVLGFILILITPFLWFVGWLQGGVF